MSRHVEAVLPKLLQPNQQQRNKNYFVSWKSERFHGKKFQNFDGKSNLYEQVRQEFTVSETNSYFALIQTANSCRIVTFHVISASEQGCDASSHGKGMASSIRDAMTRLCHIDCDLAGTQQRDRFMKPPNQESHPKNQKT